MDFRTFVGGSPGSRGRRPGLTGFLKGKKELAPIVGSDVKFFVSGAEGLNRRIFFFFFQSGAMRSTKYIL